MTKKKNHPKPSQAKATDAAAKTKTTEAAKPVVAEDVKTPESKTVTETKTSAEPKTAAEPKKDEKSTFPLYTLLAAGTVIVATFIITNNMWSRDAQNTALTAQKTEKPAVHIVSGKDDTGELTPFEIENILSGTSPVTPTQKPSPESFKAIQPDQASNLLPPQDALEAEQDALEDMIDDASYEDVPKQKIEKIEKRFSKLSSKVKNLRVENHSLKRQIEMLQKQQQHTSLNAAISGLSFAISNGDNFEAPLEQLSNMHNTPVAISRGIATLDALPTRQVLKPEELSQRLTQTARDYQNTLATGDDASVWDKTLHNLTSSIHIRKVGTNHEGDDDGAIIARAEAQVDSGDIDESLAEISALSPSAAEFFASWVTLAKEHQTANAVASRMVQHLTQGDAS